MMKFLFPLLVSLIFSGSALGQSSSEEAIILNQELQFLENSIQDIKVERTISEAENKDKSQEEPSLESKYFKDAAKDEIRTRSAARKRVRGF
jgi:hypothetical protein